MFLSFFFFHIFISVLTFWPFLRRQFPADWPCSIRFDLFIHSFISLLNIPSVHGCSLILGTKIHLTFWFFFSVYCNMFSTSKCPSWWSGPDLLGCSSFKTNFSFCTSGFNSFCDKSHKWTQKSQHDSFASLDLRCTDKVLSPPLAFIKIWN